MEWRRKRSKGVVALVAAIFWLALPAAAHNGTHHTNVINDAEAGPFLISAWAHGGLSKGDVPIYVEVRGTVVTSDLGVIVHAFAPGEEPVTVELERMPSVGLGAWEGTLSFTSSGTREIVVEVASAGGDFRTSPAPLEVSIAGLGFAVLVLVLTLQVLAFLGWLALRLPRAVGRQPARRAIRT